MIDKICDKERCTGCFACQNICPSNAIELKEDEGGCLYPVISEKCTECGLCRKVCPSLNPVEFKSPKKAYAAYSKNENIRKTSASGGLSAMIAQAFDGIVYGAAFDGDLNVNHIRVENKADLPRLQNSKYVHSHINKAYTEVKQDLENGKKVLFTGTPCQIAGLKAFLGKEEALLYTLDIVCHGVPERSTLRDYIGSEFSKLDKESAEIRFRDEKGWHMTLWEGGEFKGDIPFSLNYYYHGFMEGWTYRKACYSCPYAKAERVSDLTVCDFWGVEGERLQKELRRGLNAALVNTDKGGELINLPQKSELFCEEHPTYEVISGNGQLRHPTEETKNSERFTKLKYSRGSVYALKNTVLKKRIAFTIRKIKNAGNSNN